MKSDQFIGFYKYSTNIQSLIIFTTICHVSNKALCQITTINNNTILSAARTDVFIINCETNHLNLFRQATTKNIELKNNVYQHSFTLHYA